MCLASNASTHSPLDKGVYICVSDQLVNRQRQALFMYESVGGWEERHEVILSLGTKLSLGRDKERGEAIMASRERWILHPRGLKSLGTEWCREDHCSIQPRERLHRPLSVPVLDPQPVLQGWLATESPPSPALKTVQWGRGGSLTHPPS
ncbi:unnamed protein product [Lepidochelys kempii]